MSGDNELRGAKGITGLKGPIIVVDLRRRTVSRLLDGRLCRTATTHCELARERSAGVEQGSKCGESRSTAVMRRAAW